MELNQDFNMGGMNNPAKVREYTESRVFTTPDDCERVEMVYAFAESRSKGVFYIDAPLTLLDESKKDALEAFAAPYCVIEGTELIAIRWGEYYPAEELDLTKQDKVDIYLAGNVHALVRNWKHKIRFPRYS